MDLPRARTLPCRMSDERPPSRRTRCSQAHPRRARRARRAGGTPRRPHRPRRSARLRAIRDRQEHPGDRVPTHAWDLPGSDPGRQRGARSTRSRPTGRGLPPGAAVDPEEAAVAAAHLGIRVAHTRDAFASAVAGSLGGVEELVLDPPAMAKHLKREKPVPSRVVRHALRQLRAERRAEPRKLGLSRVARGRPALHHIRAESGGAVEENAPLMAALMRTLCSRAGAARGSARAPGLASRGLLRVPLRPAGWRLGRVPGRTPRPDGGDAARPIRAPRRHARAIPSRRRTRSRPPLGTTSPPAATPGGGGASPGIGERAHASLGEAVEAGAADTREHPRRGSARPRALRFG